MSEIRSDPKGPSWRQHAGAAPRDLKPKHIWALRTRLQIANRMRDLAMFNLAIDSKLRGCDLVTLIPTDGVSAANRASEGADRTTSSGNRTRRDHLVRVVDVSVVKGVDLVALP